VGGERVRRRLQPEARLPRLGLEDEEPARVVRVAIGAARRLLVEREAEEGDVRRERSAEQRMAFLLAERLLVVRVDHGRAGVDVGVRVAAKELAADDENESAGARVRPVGVVAQIRAVAPAVDLRDVLELLLELVRTGGIRRRADAAADVPEL